MKENKGQSLVEALIAVAVVIVLITGIVAGTTSSLRASAYARARSEATKLVQEAMETARNERDKSWSSFKSTYTGNAGVEKYFCLSEDNIFGFPTDPATCTGNITFSSPPLTILYTRYVVFVLDPSQVTDNDENTIMVRAVVKWKEGDGTRTSQAETYLTSAWE